MATKKEIAASVSDAEIEILQVLWKNAPLGAADIIERLEGETSTHPRTVKTLINRLLKKGALQYREQDRKYLYSPFISKEEFYSLKTQSFLNKFFDGELSPLVSFFSSQNKLSEKELKELRELVDRLEAEKDD